MTRMLTLCGFLLATCCVWAQQQAVPLDVLTPIQDRSVDWSQTVSDYQLFEYEAADRFSSRDFPETITLELPTTNRGMLTLDATRTNVTTEYFTLQTSESDGRPVPYAGGAHYRGTVRGAEQSLVFLSVFEDEIMGMIDAGDGVWTLGKLDSKNAREARHVLYNGNDLLVAPDFECGNLGQDLPADLQQAIDRLARHGADDARSSGNNCVNVYLELEFGLVSEKGGATGAANFMTGLWNMVMGLYQNENLYTPISDMFAWTTPDNYVTTSTVDVLYDFRAKRTTFNGDLAHLVSRGAPSGGGIAFLDALCNPLNVNYAYSYIQSSYSQLPTYSWSVNVLAHEMGHNLGSPHTHACVWNGNNSAIDGCGPTSNPIYSEGSCSVGPIPNNTVGGTIMSYCHLPGNGAGGIRPINGFGIQPGDLIRDRVANASCLSACSNTCLAATLDRRNISCNGADDGSLTALVSGGTPPYSYAWSTGATTATVTNLAAGTYTVTISDSGNCSEVLTGFITNPVPLEVLELDRQIVGNANGKIDLLPKGGVSPYSYQWSNNATTQTIDNLAAGTYSYTVTDGGGCTVTGSVEIQNLDVTCTDNIFKLTLQTDQYPNDLSYTLVDEQFNPLYEVILDGYLTTGNPMLIEKYFCLPDGCYGIRFFDVTSNGVCNAISNPNGYFQFENITTSEVFYTGCQMAPIAGGMFCTGSANLLNATVTDVSCAGGADGTITLNSTAPISAPTYTWSNNATGTMLTGLAAGSYTVTVTDQFYNDVVTYTISEPAPLVLNPSSTNATNGNNGTASVSVSGGTAPYTYNWSGNNGTTSSISGLAAGTYTVTVIDDHGCVETASVNVVGVTPPVTVSLTKTDALCNGDASGSITSSVGGGTGTYTYLWSDNATTANLNNVAAGTYSVTVTSGNQTATASITINEPIAIGGFYGATGATNGANGSVSGSGFGGTAPLSYAWSNGATTTAISGLAPGTYSVTITDASGCTFTDSYVVTDDTPAVSLTISGTDLLCNGDNSGSVSVVATGGTGTYTYAWSNGAITATQSGLIAGTYSVTVTSFSQSAVASVTINEPAAVTSTLIPAGATNGTNGGINVITSGGTAPYTYAWSNSTTNEDLTGVAPGVYTVTITDANGCTFTASETVPDETPQVFLNISGTDLGCNGDNSGTVSVTALGGTGSYTYAWSNNVTTATQTGLPAGTYSVTVTSFSQTATASVTINEPATLVLTTNSTGATNGNNGTASVGVSGGTAPYNYAWSNNATTSSITGLAVGTYTVTVTDANGCTETASVQVANNTPLTISTSGTNLLCYNDNSGTVSVTVNSGVGPFTYAWSNGGTTATQTGLAAGSYTVTVTSPTQTSTASVGITEPAWIVLVTSSTDANLGTSNGSATVSASGGTGPYTYLWNTGATTYDLTGVPAGTYTVTVTDANGCTESESITVGTIYPPLTITTSATDVLCNGDSNGSASATASGGTGTYTFTWGQNNAYVGSGATLNNLPAGTYQLVVQSGSQSAQALVTIGEPAALALTTSSTDATNGSNGTASVSAAGGTAPYTYAWSNNATTGTASGLAAGAYTVTVTDANGCAETASVNVADATPPLVLSIIGGDPHCFGDNSGDAIVTATGGTGTYTYLWSNGATTANNTPLTAGTYSVTVTSGSQTATASITLTEPTQVVATISVTDATQGNADGSATATVTGGVPPYLYIWSNGATTATANNLAAGTYQLEVQDANTCQQFYTVTIGSTVPTLESYISEFNVTCAGGNNGEAKAIPSGGTGTYTYQWSNGATTQTILNLTAGYYSVTITSGTQTKVDGVQILEPNPIVANASGTDATNGNNGTVSVNPTGGTGALSVVWNTGATTNTITGLAPGIYTATITDANGCVETATVEVKNLNAGCTDNEVIVTVQLDNYAVETAWTLYDDNNQVVAFGNQYTNANNNQLITETLCLPDGCYSFQITDAYGDGICCAYGQGYYQITSGGNVLASGGQFGTQEWKSVCLNATPGIKAEQGHTVFTDGNWQTVQLDETYQNPVIIATPVTAGTSVDPVVTRLRNVTGTSFDLRVQRPKNGTNVNDTYRVEYLVVEEGIYTQAVHGIQMEAVRANSSRTAAKGRWGSTYREIRSYQNTYQNPVVLGQVMSHNDPDWSVFWASRHNSRTQAPTSNSFAAGKHVGEDTDRTRSNEEIGYIVVEAGGGNLAGGEFRAGLGADIVRGQQNNQLGYVYNVPNFMIFGGVLSSAAMDGNDGGWATFKADPLGTGGISVAVDEDQIQDNERAHTTEQLAWMVFGQTFNQNLQTPDEGNETPFTGPLTEVPTAPVAENELAVFPNPANGLVTVRLHLPQSNSVQLTVLDLTGRQMQVPRAWTPSGAQEDVRLDVTDWTPGVYFVRLLTDDGKLLTQRLVVR